MPDSIKEKMQRSLDAARAVVLPLENPVVVVPPSMIEDIRKFGQNEPPVVPPPVKPAHPVRTRNAAEFLGIQD
jgi:hypothetical protein